MNYETMKNELQKFKLMIFNWVSGELQKVEKEFDKVEDAIEESGRHGKGNHKVYDHEGNLVHSKDHDRDHDHDSYA